MVDVSIGDATQMMGYVRHTLLNASYDQVVGVSPNRASSKNQRSFDSRTKWESCRSVINHVRDQGMCGSCWAMSATTAMDGRLCIATRGKFAGINAWLSAGYVTSCFSFNYKGCDGGDPAVALQNARFMGIPTGSPATN